MKLYLAVRSVDYEAGSILGVFTDVDKAKSACEQYVRKWYSDDPELNWYPSQSSGIPVADYVWGNFSVDEITVDEITEVYI